MSGKRAWKKYMKLIRDFNDPQNTEEYYENLIQELRKLLKTIINPVKQANGYFDYWVLIHVGRDIEEQIESLEMMGYGS